jgi:hypothetical protein
MSQQTAANLLTALGGLAELVALAWVWFALTRIPGAATELPEEPADRFEDLRYLVAKVMLDISRGRGKVTERDAQVLQATSDAAHQLRKEMREQTRRQLLDRKREISLFFFGVALQVAGAFLALA